MYLITKYNHLFRCPSILHGYNHNVPFSQNLSFTQIYYRVTLRLYNNIYTYACVRLCENGRFFSENGKFCICTMNNMRISSEYKTLYSSDKFHFISEKLFSGANLKVIFDNSEIHIGKYAFTGFCEHLIAVKHKSEFLLIHSGGCK